MAKKINVLKPFRFSAPARDGKLPVERHFPIGSHEIDDETANHAWIKAGADGHIESDEAALERALAAKAKADQAHAEAVNATAQAEEAFERLVRSQPEVAKKYELSERALNTPVGELRSKQDGDNSAEEAAKTKAEEEARAKAEEAAKAKGKK